MTKTIEVYDVHKIIVLTLDRPLPQSLYANPDENKCPKWLIQFAFYREAIKTLEINNAIRGVLHINLTQDGVSGMTDYFLGAERWALLDDDWTQVKYEKHVFFTPERWRTSFELAAGDLSLAEAQSRTVQRKRTTEYETPKDTFHV